MVSTRSKKQKKNSNIHVPSELTEEILCLLPVKDLLRFRAVCKAWKTLIDSNSFKNKHFEAANNSLLILRQQYGTTQTNIDLLSPTEFLVSHSLPLHLSQFLESFNYYKNTFPEFYAFGLDKGLLCLVYPTCFVLWNPSTRAFWSIDSPPRNWVLKILKELNLSRRIGASEEFCAFWFDNKTGDYKIVIAQFTIKEKALIQLYSSRTNSWKGLTQDFPYVSSNLRSDALLDGSFYWLAKYCRYNGRSSYSAIFRFDFREEVFKLIPFSEDFTPRRKSVVVTTRGCLELITIFDEGKEQRCEVWAMGENRSWSRKLWFGFCSRFAYPRGITKDGQVIFKSGEEILLINPTSGSCEHIVYSTKYFWVYTYVESLFSIKH